MNIPVFDLHCDTALGLLGKSHNEAYSLKKNSLQIDLSRASCYPGYCQCFACFTTPYMQERMGVSPVVMFERELASIQREVDANKHLIRIAYSADDIETNYRSRRMSAVLTLEGAAGYGFDPALLEDMHQIGFRVASLGWNEKNDLTGSNVTGGGLTDLGREFVKEAQRLGILVDVSHISDEGFYQIAEMTQAPVVATHSNSRSVWNHSRNLTDDMFRIICQTGGVTGINQGADFLGESPDMDTICRHIIHFLEMDPEAEHIALGGDLDGVAALSEGFEGIQSYTSLADKLLTYGVNETMLWNIYWNNSVRVFRSAQKGYSMEGA